MKTIGLMVFVVFIQGCSIVNTESDSTLSITTEKQVYYVSEMLEVKVTFENKLGKEISIFNAGCGFPEFMLERLEDNEWKYSGGPVCVAIAIPPTLVKNGNKYEATVGMFAEDHIVSGIHRMKFFISEGDGRTILESKYLYSNIFQVVKE